MTGGHTYREAGVDIDLEAEAVSALVGSLLYRREGEVKMSSSLGHFAGLLSFGDHVLALAVDGVGTKMLVADALSDWSTVGIDCIAMNVNDLYVMNIEPVAFVDYIAADSLSVEQMAQIGEGLSEGARQANIDIIGGETATLKGLVTGLDLAGTCLGMQKKDAVITGEEIREGDCIVGVASSGIHSNGLTLARTIAEEKASLDQQMPWGASLGEELLRPTRIYAEALSVTAAFDVHGMCHITGGGLRNLTRLGDWGFEIDDPLTPSPLFDWLSEAGGVAEDEMYRTFNMGMGYVYIVPEEEASSLCRKVPGAAVVGRIHGPPGVRLRGRPFK